MAKTKTDTGTPEAHPSQDGTHRFAVDTLLRKCGFTIFARRSNESPVWQRNGKLYKQRQALRTIDRDLVLNYEHLQDAYLDGKYGVHQEEALPEREAA